MAKFELADQPNIDLGNPVWKTIEGHLKSELESSRNTREQEGVEPRKLDLELGRIQALKAVLALPAEIKKERKRKDDPITGDGFGIPPLTVTDGVMQ